ncbi:CinA family protein [Novosphingobium sp. Gsoil 351]|uniref:CinA family protein n=1 Tax=Novosphingobium sp. Gsoil 351 TaxID=2675225 RepID=UPI00351B625F
MLTDQQGLGKWFDRGFVVYTEKAKCEVLGLEPIELAREGVVSAAIAKRLAEQALERSDAGASVGVTGFAGPAGQRDEAGLVYLAVTTRNGYLCQRECHFGDVGRDRTRALAARAALEMLDDALSAYNPGDAA